MRRAAGALALAVALSACSGLPTSTPIQTGRPVGGVAPDAIRVAVQGPVPGADAREVVAGFLRASVAFDDDPSVAQEFLTPAGAGQWRPHEVVIYENSVTPTITVTGARATVVVPVTGALDAEGHYRELPAGSTRRLALTLDKASGEWRIASGLEGFGAMMSRGDFARYASFTIAYASPRGDVLVPDERWLAQGPGLPTRLARAVLAAPPTYLQGAVVTGAPDYTELVGSVAVADGVAKVQVNERMSDTDQATRRVLWARMAATLAQVRGVEAVQLSIGDTRLAVDGLPDRPLRPADVPLSSPSLPSALAVTRTGETLRAVATSSLRPGATPTSAQDAPVLPRLPLSWYHLALAADGSELAAVGGDDAELARWRAGRQVRIPRFATSLSRPTYDRDGVLWVAGRVAARAGSRLTETERLFVLDTRAAGTAPTAPVQLAVPWLVGRSVLSVQVAADGQRVAVVSAAEKGGGTRVDVAGITRRGTAPVALAEPRTVAVAVGQVVDATWLDGATLALLGRASPTLPLRVVVAPLNDTATHLGEVARAEGVTSLGDSRSVAVVTSDRRVLIRAGATFARLLDSSELLLPGR